MLSRRLAATGWRATRSAPRRSRRPPRYSPERQTINRWIPAIGGCPRRRDPVVAGGRLRWNGVRCSAIMRERPAALSRGAATHTRQTEPCRAGNRSVLKRRAFYAPRLAPSPCQLERRCVFLEPRAAHRRRGQRHRVVWVQPFQEVGAREVVPGSPCAAVDDSQWNIDNQQLIRQAVPPGLAPRSVGLRDDEAAVAGKAGKLNVVHQAGVEVGALASAVLMARVHLPAAREVGGLGYVTTGFASWNAANRSALWRCQATAEPLRHHGFAAAFAAVPARSDSRRRQLPSDADRRLFVVNRFGHSTSRLCSPAPVAINNASVSRNTRWSSASRAPVSVRAI